MRLASLILAQSDTLDLSWQDAVLGPYGALALAMGAILWLTRQLTAERKANRELSDRMVDKAERMIPVLTANTAELERRRRP